MLLKTVLPGSIYAEIQLVIELNFDIDVTVDKCAYIGAGLIMKW